MTSLTQISAKGEERLIISCVEYLICAGDVGLFGESCQRLAKGGGAEVDTPQAQPLQVERSTTEMVFQCTSSYDPLYHIHDMRTLNGVSLESSSDINFEMAKPE